MKILHSLLVAALLLGTSSFALASPGPGDHDRRDQHSGHNDHRRGGDHDRHGRHHDRYERRYDNRPVVIYRNDSRHYGHQRWRRGYRYYRLRQPPRGYRWVRADNNDYLLVAIATGIILDIAMR